MGVIASKTQHEKDLALIVEGQKFSVDKSVLALHSCVFSKMLDLKSKDNQLTIENMDTATMKELLRYMYDQNTSGLNGADVIIKVLIAAKTYEIEELMTIAMNKLTAIITNDNAIYVLKLAIHYKNTDVLQSIIEVIVNKSLPIMKSDEMKAVYETDDEIAPLFIRNLFDNQRRVSSPIQIPARKLII